MFIDTDVQSQEIRDQVQVNEDDWSSTEQRKPRSKHWSR